MQKFITFGETMVQYNAEYTGKYDPSEKYFPDVAGAESNVAINLSKITGDLAEIFWISRLGQDPAGYLICLLYTSPSPRDGLLSRMPSSA